MIMQQFDPLFQDSLEVLLRDRVPDPVGPCLVLHPTEQCPAECAHCVVMAGPRRVGFLDRGVARGAIRGAAAVEGLRFVILTGGETFLALENVVSMCREAREWGLRTRVVTNGFWARSPEEARRTLERLAGEGIDQLAVSFDQYHLPWIEPERVRNVFLGARRATDLPYLVFSAVIPTVPGAWEHRYSSTGVPWPRAVLELLHRYGFSPEECVPRELVRAQAERLDPEDQARFRAKLIRNRAVVHWNPLSLGGRATRELAADIEGWSIDEDWTGCAVAGFQVTVPSSARLYPCCSVWSNSIYHHFGAVTDAGGFAAQVTAMMGDPVVRTIREQGPVALIRQLRRQGVPLPDRFYDICHACEEMISAVPLRRLRAAAERLAEVSE
jgi:hypothetical protein